MILQRPTDWVTSYSQPRCHQPHMSSLLRDAQLFRPLSNRVCVFTPLIYIIDHHWNGSGPSSARDGVRIFLSRAGKRIHHSWDTLCDKNGSYITQKRELTGHLHNRRAIKSINQFTARSTSYYTRCQFVLICHLHRVPHASGGTLRNFLKMNSPNDTIDRFRDPRKRVENIFA